MGSARRSCYPPCSPSSTATSKERRRRRPTRWSAPRLRSPLRSGPLLGGFITTYLSWRVAFLLEVVVIAIVLVGIRLVRDVPYTGPRRIDAVGALLSVLGMGGIVLGILVWQEGGESVAALLAIGAIALGALVLLARATQTSS